MSDLILINRRKACYRNVEINDGIEKQMCRHNFTHECKKCMVFTGNVNLPNMFRSD